MKTIKPIRIEGKQKETLIDASKRAINNSQINYTLVEFVFQGINCLVYPNDSLTKIIHWVKLHMVMKQLEELEAKLA